MTVDQFLSSGFVDCRSDAQEFLDAFMRTTAAVPADEDTIRAMVDNVCDAFYWEDFAEAVSPSDHDMRDDFSDYLSIISSAQCDCTSCRRAFSAQWPRFHATLSAFLSCSGYVHPKRSPKLELEIT